MAEAASLSMEEPRKLRGSREMLRRREPSEEVWWPTTNGHRGVSGLPLPADTGTP